MNVLYVIDPSTIGGAAKSFKEMVSSLRDNYGIKAIVCGGKFSEFSEKTKGEGIVFIDDRHLPVMAVDGKWILVKHSKKKLRNYLQHICWYFHNRRMYKKYNLIALRRVSEKIDFSEIDLIHTNSSRNDFGCYLSKKYGIPHIMHLREFGDADFECSIFKTGYHRFINKNTRCFVAVSNAVAKKWNKKGIKKDNIRIVYNGINFNNIDVVNSSKFDDEQLRMVVVGGVCEAKGQILILKALSQIPISKRNKISLDIYGWGEHVYISKLVKMAKDLRLNVDYKGPVNNIDKVLCNYQVGLMCSRCEGFGRVTAEYMFAGLGVIASDSGANPELITDQVTGLIFSNGNINDLASKITMFFEDRYLLKRCSELARKEAMLKFTQLQNAKSIFTLYTEFIKECNN